MSSRGGRLDPAGIQVPPALVDLGEGRDVRRWILVLVIEGDRPVDLRLTVLSAINILGALVILAHNWINAWRVSGLVLDNRRARLLLMLRVNPVFVIGVLDLLEPVDRHRDPDVHPGQGAGLGADREGGRQP